jgi:hypothetical protein
MPAEWDCPKCAVRNRWLAISVFAVDNQDSIAVLDEHQPAVIESAKAVHSTEITDRSGRHIAVRRINADTRFIDWARRRLIHLSARDAPIGDVRVPRFASSLVALGRRHAGTTLLPTRDRP